MTSLPWTFLATCDVFLDFVDAEHALFVFLQLRMAIQASRNAAFACEQVFRDQEVHVGVAGVDQEA